MGKRGNWRKRERLRRRLAITEHECWLCKGARGPLDLSIPRWHPLAVEIDEEVPYSKGGDPLDIENTHLVHRCCNLAKGAMVLPEGAFSDAGGGVTAPEPSREW